VKRRWFQVKADEKYTLSLTRPFRTTRRTAAQVILVTSLPQVQPYPTPITCSCWPWNTGILLGVWALKCAKIHVYIYK